MHNFGLPHLSVWGPLYDVCVIMGTLPITPNRMGAPIEPMPGKE